MKERLFLLLITLFTFHLVSAQQRSCHSNEYLLQQLQADPDRQTRMNAIEKQTKIYIANHSHNHEVNGTITIPVVVHVVYENNTQNISEAQIQSQIDVLNLDFRRLNTDANNTWPQADDIEIEFCMATVDPNGNTTNGITRTSTNNNVFTDDDKVKFTNQGGQNVWDASKYMNMWVCELDGFLGYAQFPGGPANTDGVVCDYRYFGTTGTAAAPFDLGRTATHEVGHYLNLSHIWGDGGCGVDDNVSDTPQSDAANYGCTATHSSCGSVDMVQNYMDYSDDACMNLFTTGQKNRMRALFDTGGERESLLNSTACGGGGGGGGTTCDAPTGVNSNAGNTNSTISWTAASNAQSYDVQYRPTGGTWTTNSNISGTSHMISGLTTCTQYNVRVRTDCGTENSSYSSISNFTTTGCSTGCNDNSATLTIVPDSYGSEITWEIKSGNNILYSGGPYTDGNTTPVVVDLCLVDGCFDFVINDSYGDGICCTEGNGSYNIESNGTVLASGGQFGNTETKNFCVGSTPPPTSCENPYLTKVVYPNNNTRVVLNWTAVPDAIKYDIRYKVIGTPNSSYTTISTANTVKAMRDLDPTAGYQVQIRTECSSGVSSWSAIYRLSRNVNLCSVTTNISDVKSITTNSARIFWHGLSNANKYQIQYKPTNSNSWTTKSATNTKKTITGLSSGTTYDLRVRARCSGSWISWSGIFRFTTLGNSSRETVEDILTEKIELSVYPNPTSGIVNIVTKSISQNSTIRIFNTMGGLIRELPKGSIDSNIEINLENLPEGIYIIRLNDGEQSITKKLSLVKY